MKKEVREELRIRRIWVVLEYARLCGNAVKACKEFNVNRSSFYVWKKAFEIGGMDGLRRKKPTANNHPRKLSQEVIDKILTGLNMLRHDIHLSIQDFPVRHTL